MEYEINKILLDKWHTESVINTNNQNKPGFCIFNNTAYAIDLLHEHIKRNSRICLHTDVDMDGFGTTLILKRTLENLGSKNHLLLINKDKVHGIQQKHVDYFNSNDNLDLIIITDSSSNEIDIIKQFKCDVLCIDHHDLLHKDLLGFCNDKEHRYVIVNNNIDNLNPDFDSKWLRKKNPKTFEDIDDYHKIHDMSCALVVYELLRIYCECFGHSNMLENLRLYQWVGITLFTDVINTLNDRNQWYLDNTIFSSETEESIKIILNNINSYKATLDKSFINYSFAPLINKAIRAGASARALDIVINYPSRVLELKEYNAQQEDAINKATKVEYIDKDTNIKYTGDKTFESDNIVYDIGVHEIHPNYSGVIASKLVGNFNKNAAVYAVLSDGTCKGSFRGRQRGVDYRKYFSDYSSDIYAQGHPEAFGFKLKKEQLDDIMSSINSIEETEDERPLLSLGNVDAENRGIYHIDNLLEFKQAGGLFKLATGNSKVNSNDVIYIRVNTSDLALKNTKGKLFIYDVLGGTANGGLECKAFKPVQAGYCDIYAEYSNELELFIREKGGN